MNTLQITIYLFIGILWSAALLHIVKSQYWTSNAKAAWLIAFLFGNFLVYSLFLIGTCQKSKRQQASAGIHDKEFTCWFIWLLILGGNGLFVYLSVMFGLTGIGSLHAPIAQSLIVGTALGVGIPLLASLYCMLKQRFSSALTYNVSIVPLIFAFTLVVDLFIKP